MAAVEGAAEKVDWAMAAVGTAGQAVAGWVAPAPVGVAAESRRPCRNMGGGMVREGRRCCCAHLVTSMGACSGSRQQ